MNNDLAGTAETIFQYVLTFGQAPESIIIIAAPFAIGAAIVATVATLRFYANKRSRQALDDAAQDIAGDSQVSPSLKPLEETWSTRLRQGLAKTRQSFAGVASLFSSPQKIDKLLLEKIHEILYRADVGVKTADRLVEHLEKNLRDKEQVLWADVEHLLKTEIGKILEPAIVPAKTSLNKPRVILFVGVNGVGKTTSIGKIGANYRGSGMDVLLCAADTFRAAAIDQLKVWAERIDCDIVAHKEGSDPAAVAFDGLKAAKSRNVDVLLVDTAGRLHSKKELMDELSKIKRVLSKEMAEAPHEVWLVIDATTGQNAAAQVQSFMEVVDITGLVITKLDGTAKGGVVIGITDQHKLPIRFIGVGEQASDLRPFDASDFASSLFSSRQDSNSIEH